MRDPQLHATDCFDLPRRVTADPKASLATFWANDRSTLKLDFAEGVKRMEVGGCSRSRVPTDDRNLSTVDGLHLIRANSRRRPDVDTQRMRFTASKLIDI